MTITRQVTLEFNKEYDNIEDAEKDEDNFLKEIISHNAEIVANRLLDECDCDIIENDY